MSEQRHTDCSEIVLRVFEYIDDEMSAEDCARVKAHLDDCPECLDEYQRDLLLKSLVQRSCGCESAPDSLRMSIMTRITSIRVTYSD